MILELVMNVLKSFLLFVIGLFPSVPNVSWLTGYLVPVANVIASVDCIVDVGTVCLCMSLLLIFSHIDLVWGIIMWVIRKIPGVS